VAGKSARSLRPNRQAMRAMAEATSKSSERTQVQDALILADSAAHAIDRYRPI
jgi:hypothetical protein